MKRFETRESHLIIKIHLRFTIKSPKKIHGGHPTRSSCSGESLALSLDISALGGEYKTNYLIIKTLFISFHRFTDNLCKIYAKPILNPIFHPRSRRLFKLCREHFQYLLSGTFVISDYLSIYLNKIMIIFIKLV